MFNSVLFLCTHVDSSVARNCEETAPNHFLLLDSPSSDSFRRMLYKLHVLLLVYPRFLLVFSQIQ
jgi:hypothetical protein